MKISREGVSDDIESAWQMLRVVAGVSLHHAAGVEPRDLVVDGCVLWIMVGFP